MSVLEIDRMFAGSVFHCLGPQKENALSPNVFVRTLGMESVRVSEEDRRLRAGE